MDLHPSLRLLRSIEARYLVFQATSLLLISVRSTLRCLLRIERPLLCQWFNEKLLFNFLVPDLVDSDKIFEFLCDWSILDSSFSVVIVVLTKLLTKSRMIVKRRTTNFFIGFFILFISLDVLLVSFTIYDHEHIIFKFLAPQFLISKSNLFIMR